MDSSRTLGIFNSVKCTDVSTHQDLSGLQWICPDFLFSEKQWPKETGLASQPSQYARLFKIHSGPNVGVSSGRNTEMPTVKLKMPLNQKNTPRVHALLGL